MCVLRIRSFGEPPVCQRHRPRCVVFYHSSFRRRRRPDLQNALGWVLGIVAKRGYNRSVFFRIRSFGKPPVCQKHRPAVCCLQPRVVRRHPRFANEDIPVVCFSNPEVSVSIACACVCVCVFYCLGLLSVILSDIFKYVPNDWQHVSLNFNFGLIN